MDRAARIRSSRLRMSRRDWTSISSAFNLSVQTTTAPNGSCIHLPWVWTVSSPPTKTRAACSVSALSATTGISAPQDGTSYWSKCRSFVLPSVRETPCALPMEPEQGADSGSCIQPVDVMHRSIQSGLEAVVKPGRITSHHESRPFSLQNVTATAIVFYPCPFPRTGHRSVQLSRTCVRQWCGAPRRKRPAGTYIVCSRTYGVYCTCLHGLGDSVRGIDVADRNSWLHQKRLQPVWVRSYCVCISGVGCLVWSRQPGAPPLHQSGAYLGGSESRPGLRRAVSCCACRIVAALEVAA